MSETKTPVETLLYGSINRIDPMASNDNSKEANDNSPIAFFWNSDPKHTAEAAAEYKKQLAMTPKELEAFRAENLAKSEAWLAEQSNKPEQNKDSKSYADQRREAMQSKPESKKDPQR